MTLLSPATERRLQRLSATISVSLCLMRGGISAEFEAFTVDVSHTGLKLRTNFPLFPSDLVGLAPEEGSEPGVQARVVWVKRSPGGGSLAGLEFLESSPV